MSSVAEAFVAILFLAWPVPEGHPAHGYLAEPGETAVTMQVAAFPDAQSCKDFIAAASGGGAADMLPVNGAQVMDAECRKL